MKKHIALLVMLQFSITYCYAQSMGARLSAMGNSNAAVFDSWNAMGNPAAIRQEKRSILAISYLAYLNNLDLSNQSGLFSSSIGKYVGALTVNRYGINAYNEIQFGFLLAREFDEKLSFGLKVNYHQLKITNYGTTTGFSIDIGTIYKISDLLNVGLYLSNPSRQGYQADVTLATLPTIFSGGISYQISDKLLLATTICKTLSEKINPSLGIEYQIVKTLNFRSGVALSPFKYNVGFGFVHNKMAIDFALEHDPYLSFKPQIGLSYAF